MGVEYIGVSIPIIFMICVTFIITNKQNSKKASRNDQDSLEEMYFAIKDMKKRINNLETILYERDRRS